MIDGVRLPSEWFAAAQQRQTSEWFAAARQQQTRFESVAQLTAP